MVKQLSQRRGRASSTGLLAVNIVHGLVEEERKGREEVDPGGTVAGELGVYQTVKKIDRSMPETPMRVMALGASQSGMKVAA